MSGQSEAVAVRVDRFIATVNTAAFVGLATLPGVHEGGGTGVMLAALAVLAGAFPVRIPMLHTEVIATHPFIFCALAVVGPRTGALVAVAGVLGAALRSEARPKPRHLVFNVGAQMLATVLSAWAFIGVGGVVGAAAWDLVWPLAAATAVFFAANTGLVAQVIALRDSGSALAVWRRSFRWTVVALPTGLTLAVGLTAFTEALGPLGLALGVPPVWLLSAFYRNYKERLDEQHKRIEIMQGLNEELERRVEARTDELQQALGRIERLQSMKETLTQTLVHDLKNPLTAITGNLDLLALKVDDAHKDLVRRSRAGTNRLLRMILDLLDIDRLESGALEPRRDSLDLAGLVREAVEETRTVAARGEVDIHANVPHEPVTLRADASLVRRVVDNLLGNAIQYSPRKSSIEVEVSPAADGAVGLAVSDRGPGIPEAHRERVFDKFARVDADGHGSSNRGLGLTFCRLAVDAHGGRIWVEGGEQGGSRFRVRLPIEPPPVSGVAVEQEVRIPLVGEGRAATAGRHGSSDGGSELHGTDAPADDAQPRITNG